MVTRQGGQQYCNLAMPENFPTWCVGFSGSVSLVTAGDHACCSYGFLTASRNEWMGGLRKLEFLLSGTKLSKGSLDIPCSWLPYRKCLDYGDSSSHRDPRRSFLKPFDSRVSRPGNRQGIGMRAPCSKSESATRLLITMGLVYL